MCVAAACLTRALLEVPTQMKKDRFAPLPLGEMPRFDAKHARSFVFGPNRKRAEVGFLLQASWRSP